MKRQQPKSKSDSMVVGVLLLILLILVSFSAFLIVRGIWRSTQLSTSERTAFGTPRRDRFSEVQNIPSGLFSYGGSTTWATIRERVNPKLQEAHPEFELRYTDPFEDTPGSGVGIRMLVDGVLDFSQSSRPLEEDEYSQAEARGFTLVQRPIGIDGIAVVVNPALNVSGLTLDQLRKIYLGTIKNWRQVGGPNLEIVPLSRRPEDSGTVTFFEENVLQGQKFGQNLAYVFSTTDAIRQLDATPGGIFYASAPKVVSQCRIKPLAIGASNDELIVPYQEPLISQEQCPGERNRLNREAFQTGSYPITRKIYVIIKQDQSFAQQAGEAYFRLMTTEEGQQLVEQAGFVRIR